MTTGTPHSLRRRLLLLVLAAILFAALVQAASAWRSALHQADEMFDYHLQQMALSLRGRMGAQPFTDLPDTDSDFSIQIWGPDGTPLLRSRRPALPPRAVLGFSDVEVRGHRYRVYSLLTALHTIQIAQDLDERQARARALALRAALPTLALAPLLMLLVGWLISRSFEPVERTRRLVAARTPTDLSPLPDAGLPAEVQPLVAELNQLFGRVRTAFEAQQHFVADAAHELRSPLTALKLQVQALRERPGAPAQDAEARESAVKRLNQGVDRAILLVEQLLLLARMEAEPGDPGGPLPEVDLLEVVRLAVADTLPLASGVGVDLGAREAAAGPTRVHGQVEALRVLVRNLLDNAVKYTPAGGRVEVAVQPEGNSLVLSVEDSGPGIPAAERERVFDRFYRVPGATESAPGTGLGLPIVRAVAQRHGATVRLDDSASGGLRVEVRFSAAASAPASPVA